MYYTVALREAYEKSGSFRKSIDSIKNIDIFKSPGREGEIDWTSVLYDCDELFSIVLKKISPINFSADVDVDRYKAVFASIIEFFSEELIGMSNLYTYGAKFISEVELEEDRVYFTLNNGMILSVYTNSDYEINLHGTEFCFKAKNEAMAVYSVLDNLCSYCRYELKYGAKVKAVFSNTDMFSDIIDLSCVYVKEVKNGKY